MIYPYSPEKEESLLAQIEELMEAEGPAENPQWEEMIEAAQAKGVDVPADIAEYSPENEEALFDLIEAKMSEDGASAAADEPAAEEPAAEPAAPKSELADPAAWREFCAAAREKGLTIPMIYPYSPEREAAIREQLGDAPAEEEAEPAAPKSELADPAAWREFCASAREKGLTIPLVYPYSPEREAAIREQLGEAPEEAAAEETPAEPEPPASPFADPAAWREFCASAREKGLTIPLVYPYSPEREAAIREQLAEMGEAPEEAAPAAPAEDAVAEPPAAAAAEEPAAEAKPSKGGLFARLRSIWNNNSWAGVGEEDQQKALATIERLQEREGAQQEEEADTAAEEAAAAEAAAAAAAAAEEAAAAAAAAAAKAEDDAQVAAAQKAAAEAEAEAEAKAAAAAAAAEAAEAEAAEAAAAAAAEEAAAAAAAAAEPAAEEPAAGGGGDAVYTLDDVAAHSTPDDCWVVLYDGVYDITDFVKIHPGGAIILTVAGTDATDFFEELHKAEILDTVAAQYRIGDLG